MRKSRFADEQIIGAERAPSRIAGSGAVPQARDQRRDVPMEALYLASIGSCSRARALSSETTEEDAATTALRILGRKR
jgi:hypothetical protein